MESFILIFIMFFLFPFMQLIVGIIKPKKEINSFIGYRTAKTRSSQEMWDYGQLLMKKYMLVTGIITLLIGIVGFITTLLVSDDIAKLITCLVFSIQFLSYLLIVCLLEVAMRKKD